MAIHSSRVAESSPYRLAHTAPRSLAEVDPELATIIQAEWTRQQDTIELIASENIVSTAVMEAQGSVLTNKYAEGYSGTESITCSSEATEPLRIGLKKAVAPGRTAVMS